MNSEDYIKIFDTTLRDGEQTPGVSLTPEEKLEVARLLDKLGVDTIEAGFPIVSKGEIEGVKLIVKEGLNAEICGLSRVDKSDIDAALDCGVGCIHVFIATSDIHLKYKLKLTREEALQKAIEGVEYAKNHGVQVEFSAEDATRSDIEYLKQVYKAVEEVGADRIDIPDTVGIMMPMRIYELVSEIKKTVKLPISLHCHDDFGMAVANTLAGIEAGASRAHVTINGLGERAGNAALEEVVMALHSLYRKNTRINTQLIYETSKLVSELTGIVVQPNKAIVGDNAFSHESGIHVHGVLSTPLTYEPIKPEMVGRKRWLQAGKHAGGHGIAAKLEEMGWQPTKDQQKEILERVKDLGDKGKTVTDTDLSAIARFVMRKAAEEEKIIDLVDLAVITGIKVVPTASVKIVLDGKEYVAAETGVGPVDSAVKAIQKITDNLANIKLREYRLAAITGGSDALAEVIIKVGDKDGNVVSTRATGEDVVIASVEALIDGINKILIKKKRS
ncbi:MAG: 2-isopropylmalate synthase [Candidatus Methylarchaceae archaeon HK02M2]|nr:2-isopropylmalate synthase [Candidatus Methylarchaceae archaeon HK02M2]